MGTVNGVGIADRSSAFASGGLFRLTKPVEKSLMFQPEPGAEVELREGQSFIVARCGDCASAEEAFDLAHGTAQKALDILSAAGHRSYQISDAYEDVLLWWRFGSKQILRIGWTIASYSDMTVTIAGTSPPPMPTWHESLRYFRLSQTTDDLTESFRNLYLALESLLSLRYPRLVTITGKGKTQLEPEGVWLTRALTCVDATNPLRDAFTPKTADAVAEFITEIYKDVRCELFHAKSFSPIALPQSSTERARVSEATIKLGAVVQTLINNWLQGRRGWGGMSYYAFQTTNSVILKDVLLALEGEPTRRGISSVSIPMQIVSGNGAGLFAIRASKQGLHYMPILERAQLMRAGNECLDNVSLPGKIGLGQIDELEFKITFELRHLRHRKMSFGS